ncbi:MAG TPA: hypothetical protein VMY99_01435 [Nevskiaceae bacterium]|nr:hypothetical protein [Nevskiaceae bacterium]
MLGLGRSSKQQQQDDKLPVLVEVVQNQDTFTLAGRVWEANKRYVRQEASNHKEFLRFGMMESNQAVWLERDANRDDSFELILTWWENGTRFADIYAIVPTLGTKASGNPQYANQVLNALLTTPATLPVDKQK